jgi:hypothetical protein
MKGFQGLYPVITGRIILRLNVMSLIIVLNPKGFQFTGGGELQYVGIVLLRVGE